MTPTMSAAKNADPKNDAPAYVKNPKVRSWVADMARLTEAEQVVWCDGSEEEYQMLSDLMVKSGTYTRLNEKLRPGSYLARSHPSDVARVEDRTFICSRTKEEAGPMNNWADPVEMKKTLLGLFDAATVRPDLSRYRVSAVTPAAMMRTAANAASAIPTCRLLGAWLRNSAAASAVAVPSDRRTRMFGT